MRQYIIDKLHIITNGITVEHIRKDIGKIRLCNHFLLITEFYDTLGNFFQIRIRQFNSQLSQVVFDIRLAAGFTQSIGAFPAESFRHQVVVIKVVFFIAIGMNTGCLGKYIFTHNRFIYRYAKT